ncbi:LytTR family DNA-binding domain-containing protein [Ruminococcus sp. OA3]|uniref:LytR/AlgR family response regulator transcription factor n=1 Tax=Ruminococcus sp. OA3 TaxID=2914164 RepID=UPI001F0619E9|nr:LytTR family DNA-binding domain-containing protein [Ruminococcus sp. OA3]MCH1984071.1 LytTR family DNA-binding domain-containing protein [Ruminococcus sp. OA3]
MIDIYLCDDDDMIRQQIRDAIEKKIMIESYDMKVVSSTGNPGECLDILQKAVNKRNIYFLDVELKDPEFDGFLLGKEIRRLDPNGTLIYITSYRELAFRTFQYHLEAFDYIVKDPGKQKDSIDRCLESLHLRLQDETKKDITSVFTAKIGDTLRHIPVHEILFFETAAKPHHVILHAQNGRMEFSGNLNEIEKQMGETFIRTHRSYLAAVGKITEVNLKHGRIKVGNLECMVSRKMKSILLERIVEK